MSLSKCAAVVSMAAIFISGAWAGPNVLGVWKGHVRLNLSKFNASTRAVAQAQQAQIDKGTISLTLRADHRFLLQSSGNPNAKLNKTIRGRWSLKGRQLTLLSDDKANHPNPMTVSPDGKSMGFSLDGGVASLTFTR